MVNKKRRVIAYDVREHTARRSAGAALEPDDELLDDAEDSNGVDNESAGVAADGGADIVAALVPDDARSRYEPC